MPKTHKLSNTKEYRAWQSMKDRCYNPNNIGFPNYGKRGIRVCPEWLISFQTFLNDVGFKPKGKYSLDRINNNGNYEPGNVRWASDSQQQTNKRVWGKSKYKGVYWDKECMKWNSQIKIGKKQINLGRFDNELDAAKKFQEIYRKLKL